MGKVNDLLTQLDAAYDLAEAKAHAAATVRADAAKAIGVAQANLDAVTGDQRKKVDAAEAEHKDALVAMGRLRDQVNERIGSLTGAGTNPRVVVRG